MRGVSELVLAGLVISSCGPTERATAPPEFTTASQPGGAGAATGSVITTSIAQGTQATAGDLGIGLISVGSDDYVDERGDRRRGPLAALLVTVRSDPSRSERVRVHAGQRIEVAGYAIFVEEVREGGLLEGLSPMPGSSSGSVSLRIRFP